MALSESLYERFLVGDVRVCDMLDTSDILAKDGNHVGKVKSPVAWTFGGGRRGGNRDSVNPDSTNNLDVVVENFPKVSEVCFWELVEPFALTSILARFIICQK